MQLTNDFDDMANELNAQTTDLQQLALQQLAFEINAIVKKQKPELINEVCPASNWSGVA